MGKVITAIRQTRPFSGAAEETFVTLLHTSDQLLREVSATLKRAGLTVAQYNVLRILRGAAPGALPCGEIAGRMITRDPDITRLLDRLADQELIARTRLVDDRRVISVRITSKGLQKIAPLDQALNQVHRVQLGHLGEKRLRQLTALLDAARDGVAGILPRSSDREKPGRTRPAPIA